MFELIISIHVRFHFVNTAQVGQLQKKMTGVDQFLMDTSSRASNSPGTCAKAVSPFSRLLQVASLVHHQSPITHHSPIEVASFSTQATPEYEDYFAVDFPAPGAADDTPGLASTEVFVAAVTAFLQGHN